MEKAAELLTKGTAKPADFSLVVGASAWDVSRFSLSDIPKMMFFYIVQDKHDP